MLAEAQSPSPSAPISGKNDTGPFAIEPPPQERLRRMFDDARTQSNDNRVRIEVERDYYDGPKQLNSEVRKTLKMRGQPAIWTNRVQPAIDGILGVLEQSKVDPRCYPRTKADDDASDVATKTLRYIADKSHLEDTLQDCAENFFIEGIEAVIIEADGEEIPVTQIRFEEYFYDPYSRRFDFNDARYKGIAKWQDCDAVKAKWPEAYARLGDPMTGITGPNGALDSTWQDRPNNMLPWVDRARQRMLVVEIYYNEVRAPFAQAQWFKCCYCAAGVFEHDLSPYRNVITGETLCPIEAESCYVDRENNRYGRVRNMIPIQDEINARRSRLLHLSNSRQVEIDPNSPAAGWDANLLRREAARADGVLPAGATIIPTSDIAAGQQLLLAESKSELERTAPTPGVLAQDGRSRSGRASQVLQQAGMTELARILGRHNNFRERIYRQCWQRAQQFWQQPMWVRVTDEVKAPEFIQVNEPQLGMVQDPQTGQPTIGVVGVKNRLAELDMDIIVSTSPDTANLQQEVWGDLMDLVQKIGLQAVFSKEFAVLVEASPIQNKAEILERLKQAQGGEDPQLAQAQQMIEQLQQALQEAQQGLAASEKANKDADTAKKVAETEKIEAQTAEIEVDAHVTAFTAGQESVPETAEPKEVAADSD